MLALTRARLRRSFIVTCKLLFDPEYRRYGGSITVISLLSNTQLITMTVLGWISNSKCAKTEVSAVSLFMSNQVCANAVDTAYVFKHGEYTPDDDEDSDADDGSDDEYDEYDEQEDDNDAVEQVAVDVPDW